MEQANFLLTLLSPISLTINMYVLISFLARKSLCVDDPQFLACSGSKSCGNGQNITFPFYIQDRQESYCGLPGCEISCNNSQPTLNMSDNKYIVHEILYQNSTLRVSNADVSNPVTDCFPQTKKVSLRRDRYELVPRQTNVLLLYNCSNSSLLHGLPWVDDRCHGGNKTSLVVASPEENPYLEDQSKECTTRVVAPVQAYRGTSDGLRGVLENGFWPKWQAPDCSFYEESGGVCGFDNFTFGSQCFCADGPQIPPCGPGQFSLDRLQHTDLAF